MEVGFYVKKALRVLTSKCFRSRRAQVHRVFDGGVGGGGQLFTANTTSIHAATPVCGNSTQTLNQGKNISQKTYLTKTKKNGIQTCPKILEGLSLHPN